jgi:hypothetical protein
MLVGVQFVAVVAVPLNVTELFTGEVPKPVPVIVTVVPKPPDVGDRLEMAIFEGVTVPVVDPHTEPAQALKVTEPGATAKPLPRLLASFVTVSNVLSDVLHVTDDSTCVLVSLKVPVAVNCCVFPVDVDGVDGLSTIETRLGGVNEFGVNNSAVATALALVLDPPARKTVPLVNRVAVS